MFSMIVSPGLHLLIIAQTVPAVPPNFAPNLLAIMALFILLMLVPLLLFRRMLRRAVKMGYPTRRAYLQAIPGNDAEKRDAVDLAFKGAILCILGVVFPPLILFGAAPLYYGGRKLAMIGVGIKPATRDESDSKPV
jgi:hypothetical protein